MLRTRRPQPVILRSYAGPASGVAVVLLLLCACTPRVREDTKDAPQPTPTDVPATTATAPSAPAQPSTVQPPAAPQPPSTPAPSLAPVTDFSPAIDAMLRTRANEMATSPEPLEVASGLHELGLDRDATPFLAQAALADVVAWRPVYDLARAEQKYDDGAQSVIALALREAVRRGGPSVAKRASGDPYFRDVRGETWFIEAVQQGASAGSDASVSAPPPAPAGPPIIAVGELGGRAQPVAKADLAPIVAALQERVLATPVIRGSLQHTDPDGATVRWVVYEFSKFDACMATQTDRKAGKRLCRAQLNPTGEELSRSIAPCNEQGIARVTSLDPVTVTLDQRIDVTCKLRKVDQFAIDDYDGDGSDELLLTLRGYYDNADSRRWWVDYAQVTWILRTDGTTQLTHRLAPSGGPEADSSLGAADVARVTRVRSAGTGSHDLVLLTRVAKGDGPDRDDQPLGDPQAGQLRTTIFAYDAAADAWVVPK